MARDDLGVRVEKIATKKVLDGKPTVEKKIAGWANRTLQLGAFIDPSDVVAVSQIQIGESFVIMVGGKHEVAISATKGDAPVGTVEGDLLYIAEADNAISRNGAAAGTNEVQKIVIDATSKNWKFGFDGEETGNLLFNISAAELQAAAEKLATINPGDLVVTGGPGNSGGTTPYILTFGGQYAGENVPQASATKVDLEGGGATATASTTTPGVAPPGSMPLGVVEEIDAVRAVALVNTNALAAFLGG